MTTRHPWRPYVGAEHIFNPFVSPAGNPEPDRDKWFDEHDDTPDIEKLEAADKTRPPPADGMKVEAK